MIYKEKDKKSSTINARKQYIHTTKHKKKHCDDKLTKMVAMLRWLLWVARKSTTTPMKSSHQEIVSRNLSSCTRVTDFMIGNIM